jgi:hypothetical protein
MTDRQHHNDRIDALTRELRQLEASKDLDAIRAKVREIVEAEHERYVDAIRTNAQDPGIRGTRITDGTPYDRTEELIERDRQNMDRKAQAYLDDILDWIERTA